MRSLRARLLAAWLLSLLAALVVGAMLLGLYRQSADARQERAAEAAAESCEAIADRFAFFATGWAGPLPDEGSAEAAALQPDLDGVVAFALAGRPGVEGGLWVGTQPLAASRALPAALRASVAALVGLDEHGAATRLVDADETLLLQACAVAGPIPGLAAFAIARVPETPGQRRLVFGVGGLFALVVAMTILLGWATLAWSRRIGGIEAALAAQEAGTLPLLALTGERDLDRVVAALNSAASRLAAAQAEAAGLAARVAQSERFAALGRVAAGVAHEVRNPVAAMRLRAENALAGDDARRRAALDAILAQLGRLERLTGELLAMTQKRTPEPVTTAVRALLDACVADQTPSDRRITVDAPDFSATLDPGILRRALDELLHNASRHTPPGGVVTLSAFPSPGGLVVRVADSGPGVPPELRDNLFEPFVTGRPDGTGLGLAIAHEMIAALSGRLVMEPTTCGACFRIDIPCPTSS